MNVAKRIILLASSSAMLVGLGGCSVIDSLNIGQLFGSDGEETAAGAPAPAPAPASAPTGGGAAPFDLSAATPATNFAMPAQVQTAPIGLQQGFTTPSGFGGQATSIGTQLPSITPNAPTMPLAPATSTPVTQRVIPTTGGGIYGAQPNPYAPRIPAATTVTRATYQPSLSPTMSQPGLTVTAPNPYQPQGASSAITQPAPLGATTGQAFVASSSSSNRSINPENLSKSTISAIQAALKTRGLYSDTVDGVWGSNSQAAMARFLASRSEASVTLDTLFSLGVSL